MQIDHAQIKLLIFNKNYVLFGSVNAYDYLITSLYALNMLTTNNCSSFCVSS